MLSAIVFQEEADKLTLVNHDAAFMRFQPPDSCITSPCGRETRLGLRQIIDCLIKLAVVNQISAIFVAIPQDIHNLL